MAMALLLIAAGGVMSVLVAGAGWPARLQQGAVRETLARDVLNTLMFAGALPASSAWAPLPANPLYESQVVVTAAPFDPQTSLLEVSVRGPMPEGVERVSTLRGLFTAPNPAQLFAQYGCNGCHAVGAAAPPLSAPNLDLTSVTAGKDAQNAAQGTSLSVDAYIEQSIRDPASFVVSGYSPLMTGYPDINDMPAEDLNALREYIKSL